MVAVDVGTGGGGDEKSLYSCLHDGSSLSHGEDLD